MINYLAVFQAISMVSTGLLISQFQVANAAQKTKPANMWGESCHENWLNDADGVPRVYPETICC